MTDSTSTTQNPYKKHESFFFVSGNKNLCGPVLFIDRKRGRLTYNEQIKNNKIIVEPVLNFEHVVYRWYFVQHLLRLSRDHHLPRFRVDGTSFFRLHGYYGIQYSLRGVTLISATRMIRFFEIPFTFVLGVKSYVISAFGCNP